MASKARPSFRFTATLERVGSLYGVDVPARVSRSVGVRGHVAMVGTVNGVAAWRGSLIPRGEGKHRLYLNATVRRAAGAELGRRLSLDVRVDPAPPAWSIPEDLADVLRDEGVLATFEAFPVGRRNHILQWVEQAVHESTRAKRFGRVLEVALAEREKRLDRASKTRAPGVANETPAASRRETP